MFPSYNNVIKCRMIDHVSTAGEFHSFFFSAIHFNNQSPAIFYILFNVITSYSIHYTKLYDATALYVPMYCGITAVPDCYREDNGSLLEYSSTSAFWIFNWVANYAYSKYSYMYPDIKKVQSQWESNFNSLVPAMDKVSIGMNENDARVFLTNFSCSQAEASTAAWKKLGEYLLVKYMDGNIKKEKDGKFVQNEYKIPPSILRPGYSEEFLRKMILENPNLRMKTKEEMDNRK